MRQHGVMKSDEANDAAWEAARGALSGAARVSPICEAARTSAFNTHDGKDLYLAD